MKAKKTLGILVSGIMDEYTKSICHGVVRQSQEFNMNTIIFPGKYIERDLSDNPELMYEYQFNTVFSYARIDLCHWKHLQLYRFRWHETVFRTIP